MHTHIYTHTHTHTELMGRGVQLNPKRTNNMHRNSVRERETEDERVRDSERGRTNEAMKGRRLKGANEGKQDKVTRFPLNPSKDGGMCSTHRPPGTFHMRAEQSHVR